MNNQFTWLHIGLGSFHRAYQAWYLHRLIASGDKRWHIAAGNIRNDAEQVVQALAAQGGRYVLETVSPEGEREYEEITSIQKLLPWQAGLQPLMEGKVGELEGLAAAAEPFRQLRDEHLAPLEAAGGRAFPAGRAQADSGPLDQARARAEAHERIAQPLMAPIGALLGFAMLLLGGYSRFGVWRQVIWAIVALVIGSDGHPQVPAVHTEYGVGALVLFAGAVLALLVERHPHADDVVVAHRRPDRRDPVEPPPDWACRRRANS